MSYDGVGYLSYKKKLGVRDVALSVKHEKCLNPIVKVRFGGVVLRSGTGEADMRTPSLTSLSVSST